jgi:hypothetical protein
MYRIVARYEHESHETLIEGTMEFAWREASKIATALDSRFPNDKWGWNVRLKNEAGEDIVELFHGRLI